MIRAAAIILLVPMMTALAAVPGFAGTKCEVNTSTCIDARTGQARVCSTTICRDDKGDIVSIQTIVLRDVGTGAAPVKPRLPRDAPAAAGSVKMQ